MKRVVIESPYAGHVELNEEYARHAMADSLSRGEAPLASHLLYTQPGILDDAQPSERKLGMEAGFTWGALADACVVYTDLGLSDGMVQGIERAEQSGIPVEYRKIGWRWAEDPVHCTVHTKYVMLSDGKPLSRVANEFKLVADLFWSSFLHTSESSASFRVFMNWDEGQRTVNTITQISGLKVNVAEMLTNSTNESVVSALAEDGHRLAEHGFSMTVGV